MKCSGWRHSYLFTFLTATNTVLGDGGSDTTSDVGGDFALGDLD